MPTNQQELDSIISQVSFALTSGIPVVVNIRSNPDINYRVIGIQIVRSDLIPGSLFKFYSAITYLSETNEQIQLQVIPENIKCFWFQRY